MRPVPAKGSRMVLASRSMAAMMGSRVMVYLAGWGLVVGFIIC